MGGTVVPWGGDGHGGGKVHLRPCLTTTEVYTAPPPPPALADGYLHLHTQEGHHPSWNSNSALLAEAGSVQLEWKYLSKLTGNAVYHDTVDAFMAMLVDVDAAHFENKTLSKYPEWGHWDRANAVRGLWPVTINPETAEFNSDTVSFGGMADSFYEYLLKQYVLSAKSDKRLLKMYEHAIAGMQDKLWGYSQPNRHAFIGEIKQGHKVADMEHLACFVPGLLALGGGIGVGTKARNGKTHLQMAKELLETCYATYEASPTGVRACHCLRAATRCTNVTIHGLKRGFAVL